MDSPVEQEITPTFVLSAFNGPMEDFDINVQLPKTPDIHKHASPALLYGLAILTLDRQGTLAEAVDALLAEGPISEVDANNRINTLLSAPSHG